MKKSVAAFLSKSVKIIAVTATLVIFLTATFLMIGSIFKNDKQLSPWGTGFFSIVSGSMEPAVPAGGLVFVVSEKQNNIKEGDIITYFVNDAIVTHRVIEVTNQNNQNEIGSFITKGDANNTNDSPVAYENVIGRVLFVMPAITFLDNAPQNMIVIGTGIIAIGLILCVFSVWNNRRKKNKIENGINNLGETIYREDGGSL